MNAIRHSLLAIRQKDLSFEEIALGFLYLGFFRTTRNGKRRIKQA